MQSSMSCSAVCWRRHDHGSYNASSRRLAGRSHHVQIKLGQLAQQGESSAAAGWNTLPGQRVHWPTLDWQALPGDVIKSRQPPAWRHQNQTTQRLSWRVEERPFWWRQHTCSIARPPSLIYTYRYFMRQ